MAETSIATLFKDLTKAKSPEDFHRGLRSVLSAFDRHHDVLVEVGNVKLACQSGCSLCCHLRVDVRAPEVFLIAEFIRSRFSSVELNHLLERLNEHAEVVNTLTPFEHATRNIQCPLLQNGRCSVYAVRPHACRRCHSLDFAACQFTYDNPTDLEFPGARKGNLFRALGEWMGDFAAAYEELGYDTTIYELGSALRETLNNPVSWRRWRDQKKTFLSASVTPSHLDG